MFAENVECDGGKTTVRPIHRARPEIGSCDVRNDTELGDDSRVTWPEPHQKRERVLVGRSHTSLVSRSHPVVRPPNDGFLQGVTRQDPRARSTARRRTRLPSTPSKTLATTLGHAHLRVSHTTRPTVLHGYYAHISKAYKAGPRGGAPKSRVFCRTLCHLRINGIFGGHLTR
jgi:hypothetical protein